MTETLRSSKFPGKVSSCAWDGRTDGEARGQDACGEKRASEYDVRACVRALAAVSQIQMRGSCCERMQILIHVRVPAGVVLEHSTAGRDAAWSHGVTSTSAARESRALSWRICVEKEPKMPPIGLVFPVRRLRHKQLFLQSCCCCCSGPVVAC